MGTQLSVMMLEVLQLICTAFFVNGSECDRIMALCVDHINNLCTLQAKADILVYPCKLNSVRGDY